jgi:hypothetical protein
MDLGNSVQFYPSCRASESDDVKRLKANHFSSVILINGPIFAIFNFNISKNRTLTVGATLVVALNIINIKNKSIPTFLCKGRSFYSRL